MSVKLGHFELIDQIGRGGMGTVFNAFDTSLQRPVAIKLLDEDRAMNAEFVGEFIREAQNAAGINHPHIVQIFFAGESDGNYYIVMELLTGKSLDQIVEQDGPLPEPLSLRIAIEITEALKAAYAKGMIHGDVKPPNIILTDSNGAKLLDFGLAKLANVEADVHSNSVWGSPYYVSPERMGRKAEDFRSDIYSLGATIFEVLSGRPPFLGETNDELAAKRLSEKPPLLRTLNPKISRRTEQIIDKMLQKSPLQRYLSYEALLTDLRKAESSLLGKEANVETGELLRATRQIPVAPPRKSPLPLIIGGIVLALLIIGAVIVFVLLQSPAPGNNTATNPVPASVPKAPAAPPVPSSFTYQNPIEVPNGIRDPRIFLLNGIYYLTGTAGPYNGKRPDGVHLWSSRNLLDWKDDGLLISTAPKSWDKIRGSASWFSYPSIFAYRGQFYLVYTFPHGLAPDGTANTPGIAIAVSPNITGPYRVLTPLAPLTEAYSAALFEDTDGQVYLFADSKWAPIDLEKVELQGPLQDDFAPSDIQENWEGNLFGFTPFKRGNLYYLLYSSHARGVEVGYATAPGIRGPWTKNPGNPIFGAQARVLCRTNHKVYDQSPDVPFTRAGSGYAFFGPDGRLWYSAHGTEQLLAEHKLVLAPMIFDTAGQLSMKLTWTPQTVPIPAPQKDPAWRDVGSPANAAAQ